MHKGILAIIFFVCLLFGGADFAFSQNGGEINISPHIINERGEAGGIFEYTISLDNNTDRKISLYAVVNNLSAREGRQEFSDGGQTDRSRSLANWIEVTRGVRELDPGESKEVPLKIDVSPHAKAGEYYASVTFAEGPNRYDAEARMKKNNQPQVLINLVIKDHVVENAQLSSFYTGKKVYFNYPVSFSLEVENSGNQHINPVGEIFVYDRRGREVAALPLSAGQEGIKPNQTKLVEKIWQEGAGLGRFKAKVQMDYGRENTRDLQDTLYFWVLPWQWVMVFGAGILMLFFGLFYILFRKTHQARGFPSQLRDHHPEKSGVINLKDDK